MLKGIAPMIEYYKKRLRHSIYTTVFKILLLIIVAYVLWYYVNVILIPIMATIILIYYIKQLMSHTKNFVLIRNLSNYAGILEVVDMDGDKDDK